MGTYKMTHTGKELDDAIEKVKTGYILPSGELKITANGTQDVKKYATVNVSVAAEVPEISLQEKTATPTKSQQSVTADDGYDGLSKVTVNAIPSNYIEPTGSLSITSNGTKDVKQYASVNVNVPAPAVSLQEKTATPTKSKQEITPDSNYKGLSKVTVNAIPEEFITPTGELEITENGQKDVTNYKTVKVNVPTAGGTGEGITETATGDYTVAGTSTFADFSVTPGFKPRVFCFYATTAMEVQPDDVFAIVSGFIIDGAGDLNGISGAGMMIDADGAEYITQVEESGDQDYWWFKYDGGNVVAGNDFTPGSVHIPANTTFKWFAFG